MVTGLIVKPDGNTQLIVKPYGNTQLIVKPYGKRAYCKALW